MPDVCGVEAGRCQCVQPPAHEPPHGCDCGGSWVGEIGTDTFRVVTYPEVGGEDLFAALASANIQVRRGGIRYA